jgi:predicted NodU family carbamoyl transferase
MDSIVTIHASHDGCITYINNNKIIFHTQLDRFNKIKHSPYPSKEIIKILEKIDFNVLIISFLENNCLTMWEDVLTYLNYDLKNV